MFLKICSFDIEVVPLNINQMPTPDTCPVILISNHFNYDCFVEGVKTRNIVFVLTKNYEGVEIQEIKSGNRIVYYLVDERKLLIKEFDLIKGNDIETGYNVNNFDFPYIIDRARILGIKRINISNGDSGLYYRKHISKGFSVTKVGGLTGKILVDVLALLRREDATNVFLKKYNLKKLTLEHISKEILKMEKLEFPIEDMIKYWENTDDVQLRNKFIDYCSRDSELALELLCKFRLLDKFISLSKASGKLIQDIINSQGSGQMVENLLLSEFRKNDRVMPIRTSYGRSGAYDQEDDEELKGAYVMVKKIGVINNLGVLDYTSLYPTLMIKHNLCYSTLIPINGERESILKDLGLTENDIETQLDEYGNLYATFIKKEKYVGIIPRKLKELMELRASQKKEMKKYEKDSPDYMRLDAGQNATKILLNSFYGYTGDSESKVYSWYVASAVTTNGRKQIKKTIEMINKLIVKKDDNEYSLDVVMTDSVTWDIPVLFFEKDNSAGKMIANVLPISELYNYYYGKEKYNTLTRYMENTKEIYVQGKNGLVLLKGVYKHKVTKKGYRVSTCCGLTKVTEDHSLFSNEKEIKPTDLKEGSYIDVTDLYSLVDAVGNLSKGMGNEHSDLAWVLGLFVADGYTNCTYGEKWGKKCVWHIDQNDRDVLERCKHILDKYYKEKGIHFEIMDIMESSNVYRLYAKGKVERIVNEYREMFYTDDDYGYKKLPRLILNSDIECVTEFLKGYLLGDAYINNTGKWEFTTNSLVLYKCIEFLNLRIKNRLSRLEIDERDMIRRDKKDYKCKDRKVSYNAVIKNVLDKFEIEENRNVIRHIKEFDIKDEFVYDLTTDDSTFVCGLGGIIHHNTDSTYVNVLKVDNSVVSRDSVVTKDVISRGECVWAVNYAAEAVNETLEKPMNLAYESYIRRIVIIAKKRYAYLSIDDNGKESITSKGIETVRRDWCEYSTNTMSKIIDFILKEENIDDGVKKSIELVKERATLLNNGKIDLNELVLSKKLTKLITAYDNLAVHCQVAIKMKNRGKSSEVGDRIQYIITDNGKKLVSEMAEEADYVIKNNLKVNNNFYLYHQLIPPAMRVLGLLGVKEEMMKNSLIKGQKNLFDY